MKLSFGEFLALKRKENSLTQKELAKKLFVSESTVSKWEQNRANPDITVLPALAEILGVSEHELITSSIDSVQRENNAKAKKWSRLTFGWDLFFLIAYGVTLLTCFIVDLAVNKRLSWFFIVLSSLMLAATFTNLPRYVKKYRLLILSLSPLLALSLLLGVCCLYTGGGWFFIAAVPIVVSFSCVFLPIYTKVYRFPEIIKRHSEFFCLAINGLLAVAMIFVIQGYTLKYGFTSLRWATAVALPLMIFGAAIAASIIFLCKYLPACKCFRASAVLFFLAVILPAGEFGVDKLLTAVFGFAGQSTYRPDLSQWTGDYVNNNVQLLIFLTLVLLSVIFLLVGIFRRKREKTKNKPVWVYFSFIYCKYVSG